MSEQPSPAPRRRRVLRTVVTCALVIIPAFYAGFLVWSNVDPMHRMNLVPAAVVNEDQPVTLSDPPAGTSPDVHLGADLVANLVANTDDQNFAWVSTDAATANDGLRDGRYLAVLTIPPTFSADATSSGADDGRHAAPATLNLTTNDAANFIAGTMGKTIGQSVADDVSQQLRASYLDQVYVSLNTLHSTLSDAATDARTLANGTSKASSVSTTLSDGLGRLATQASSLPAGVHALATGAGKAASGAHSLASGMATLTSASTLLASGASTAASGATTLSTGLGKAAAGMTALSNGLAQASSGAASVDDGTQALAAALSSLEAHDAGMTDAQREAALAQLASQATALAHGTSALASSTATLAQGAKPLASSLESLKAGAGALASSLKTLSSGTTALSKGVASAASGATTVASGVASLRSGLGRLDATAPTLVGAIGQARSGAASLASGMGTLASGSRQLSDGLADGAASVPSYTSAQATALSTVASDPVAFADQHLNAVPSYGYALAPYFIAIALWVGGVVIFFMTPALSKKLLARRLPSIAVGLGSFVTPGIIAVAQSVLAITVLRFFVGIDAANLVGLYALAVLASVTFVAINQCLNAIAGPVGRFVALLLLVAQITSAGGTYPVQTTPGLFQGLHAVMPIGYAAQGFRSLVSGGSLGVGPACGVLAIWLVAALAVTCVGAFLARRRTGKSLVGGSK